MLRTGITLGQNDLNVEEHLQMGYNSKTIKNYNKPVETQPVETEATEHEPRNVEEEELRLFHSRSDR